MERGVEAVSLDDAHEGVLVELKHADGAGERIEVRWVIGAGGAHSVTRDSMAGVLAGQTYPGTAPVADVAVSCSLPRDGSALIASPAGYVLLAPLPDARWLTFVGDLDDHEIGRLTSDTSIDAVAATMRRRVASAVQLSDVGWAATFRMHRRMAAHLADGRRFLLGDAGHLSSPFGGEGLNSGLHDGHNLAWKLALELKGRAHPSLLGTFALERGPPLSMFWRSRTASMPWPRLPSSRQGRASGRLRRRPNRPRRSCDPGQCSTSLMPTAR